MSQAQPIDPADIGADEAFIAQFKLPPLQFKTTMATAADDFKFWLFEYLTNALLAAAGAKFTFDAEGLHQENFPFSELMLASINNEAAKRESLKNRLQKSRETGMLEL